jgi:tetratricopeptide (TPR) repeat protein
MRLRATVRRTLMLSLAGAMAVTSMGAQGRGGTVDPIRQTRTALAHGDLAGARQIAGNAAGDEASRVVAQALIDMFQGRDEDARARLTPVANRLPLGEASLELGLLDLRAGRISEGQRRLAPLADVRTLPGPDDYFRLARAARGIHEFLLANDAFQRIADVPRADVQTEWGDVFLERHQPADAVTNYRKALEYDAEWVPALVGLARALADDAPTQARAALEQARTQAPDHPDVALATAEQQLDAEDVDAAGEALDVLARVRPNSVDEAAMRAAIAYKRGGLDAVEAAIPRVTAINPSTALGYRLAGEQAARQYRFDDAAALARKAVAIDANDALAQFDLGLFLMRTGDEPAARTALSTSWDLDKSAPVTKNLLDLLDHLDTFDVVPHGEFIFKFAKDESAVLQAYALPLADEAYRQFSARYDLRPKGPILVEVFPVHDDFAVRTLGLPGLVGALGACFGRVVTMDSPRARPPGEFSWQATLWHELAHVFSLQSSDYRVPRWLTEGISVYEEYKREPAWGRELALEYARALGDGKNFGVKKLPEAFKHPESLSLAYFEASLVVEHLVDANGEAGLRTLLKAYANGATDSDAFVQAFGQNIDQVEASFKAFVDQRYGALSRAMRPPTPQVAADDVRGLRARAEASPGNFISQLSLGQALIKADDLEGARAPLERAAALAPQAQGDGSPHALLARIAEVQKDPVRARREYRALLTYDHTNVNAARKLAELASAAGNVDEENQALRLVADLDPFDADAHGKLGRRLLAKGDNAPALIEFQAVLALGPANPAEAHSDMAEALLKVGRASDARREALLALQSAPTFSRAQDLLLQTEGR